MASILAPCAVSRPFERAPRVRPFRTWASGHAVVRAVREGGRCVHPVVGPDFDAAKGDECLAASKSARCPGLCCLRDLEGSEVKGRRLRRASLPGRRPFSCFGQKTPFA